MDYSTKSRNIQIKKAPDFRRPFSIKIESSERFRNNNFADKRGAGFNGDVGSRVGRFVNGDIAGVCSVEV